MKLYVANCTPHHQRVYYRLDFTNSGEVDAGARFKMPKSQDIRSGQQIIIGGDLHKTQIDDIVSQLNKFGMAGVSEIGRLRTVVPYVFDIDKQISRKAIQSVVDHNRSIRSKEGFERRKKAAIAANDTLISRITEDQQLMETASEDLPKFEVSYEQEDKPEGFEGEPIGEGFRIAPAPVARGRGRPRKAG